MEKFNPDKKHECPKCGNDNLESKYGRAPNTHYSFGAFISEDTPEEEAAEKRKRAHDRGWYEILNSIRVKCPRCKHELGRFWALDVEKDFDGNDLSPK